MAPTTPRYAVESLSDALRLELRPFGVEVSIVEPGAIKTEFAEVAMGSIEILPGSPYAAAASNADAMKKQFEATEVGPAVVSRAIQNAIESRRPRARDVAPVTAAPGLWFMKLCPTRGVDAILGRGVAHSRQVREPAADPTGGRTSRLASSTSVSFRA
jgi:short-subunit dehydrogenase